jgi:hypothetical protein
MTVACARVPGRPVHHCRTGNRLPHWGGRHGPGHGAGGVHTGLWGQRIPRRHDRPFALELDGLQHSYVEQYCSGRPAESVGCGLSVCERARAGQENRVYFQSSQPQPSNRASMATTSAAIHVAAIAIGGRVACSASHTNAPVAKATIK